jgi:hypothetical protein
MGLRVIIGSLVMRLSVVHRIRSCAGQRFDLSFAVRVSLRCAIPVATWALIATCAVLAEEAPDAPGQDKQTVVTISKETTRILEPLREDGFPDYVAALEQLRREGATPDNNVAVVLWQVVGPGEISDDIRDEYFQRLGIKPLPEDGEYLVDFHTYVDDATPADDVRRDQAYDFFEEAQKAPWKRDDSPLLADWLDKYDKQLNQMVAASRRTRYYSPLVTSDDDEMSSMLISVVLPAIGQFRDVARALVARAMLRVGEGKVEEAWNDLIACHRLGRLAGQGHTLIDGLVGVAVDTLAWQGVVALAHHGKPTPEQVKKFRRALDELPPPPNMVDRVDVGERFMCLDCVCALAHGSGRFLQVIRGVGDPQSDATAKLQAGLANAVVDWDEVLKMMNKCYDRIVTAGRIPDSRLRQEALERFNEDMEKLAAKLKPGILGAPLLALGGEQGKKMISRQIGGVLLALLMPALNMALEVEYRDVTQERMEDLALALAAYRSRHGSYPDSLSAALAFPVDKLPVDAFTGAPFQYKRDGENYTLYSVGPNGKDEGGRGRDADVSGDDVTIRTAGR